MADVITDVQTYVNQALLDAAEFTGLSVWYVIASIATAVIVILLIAIYLIERSHGGPIEVYTDEGQIEFVEKTIAEFPADRVRIEGKKGKVVIKLISEKPAEAESLPPQAAQEAPKPAVAEKAKPPVSTKKEEKKEEPKSEPIAMGAVGQPPKKPEKKK
jgi:hypothetical protein